MSYRTVLTVALLFVLAALPAQAQEAEPQPARFQIRIVVDLPDEGLAERVSMYARNELRGIEDVELTEENPDYSLFFRVIEMKAGEHTIGHVLGVAVVSYFPDGYFDSVLDPRMRNAGEVAAKLEAVNVFEHQLLSVAGSREADVVQAVVNAIATFNRGVLQPKRK